MRPRAALAFVLICAVAVPAAGARPAPDGRVPLVWFAPLPRDTVVGRAVGFDGSKDFFALFDRRASWADAARRVGVFKLYGGWAANELALEELGRIVRDLERRGIALAVEDGALQSRDGCGHGVEGFVPPNQATRIASRIRAAGGTLGYVALDSTFRFGSLYDGPNACRFPPEEAARQFAAYAAEVRRVFPDVAVGDIEALPLDVDPARLVEWMDVYRRVTGRRLDFFHLDMGYRRPGWPEAARFLEDAARARGIPFGIIYFGEGSQRDGGGSDVDWTANAEQRFVTFEAEYGGRPDHAILQSWVEFPDYLLPESKPATFTWLVNRYLRPRTALTIRSSRGRMTGRLLDERGRPIRRARVELAQMPLAGPGVAGTYAISGTVPARASAATVGFRVNTECGCSGVGDFVLYDARYSEGSDPANRAPPVESWQTNGDAAIALAPADRGSGTMVSVQANPLQTAAADSVEFSVTPVSRYKVSFSARVAPLSHGSGYFTLIFRNPAGEVARRTIPLEAHVVPLGTTVTRHDGAFEASRILSRIEIRARYRGDGAHFPAYAEPIVDAEQLVRRDARRSSVRSVAPASCGARTSLDLRRSVGALPFQTCGAGNSSCGPPHWGSCWLWPSSLQSSHAVARAMHLPPRSP